ncbi:MAG: adenosylcobinamide-GDP ribazoletransferase [Scytolyngbya sp. HA4215-MV1]|jgi:adenosylcobinamide-GDP ribazoletransferase|nr:adenosylcobinamide-GDP ribazoletransferase [Scytolyngbya sp. HA4215-MV1]
MRHLFSSIRYSVAVFFAGIAFYTCVPVPSGWGLAFSGVARIAPLIGALIGGFLGLFDVGLEILGVPNLTRSVMVIAAWVGITGGLHLDGVMDTADGLAVTDPERRLAVMADSHTGAFGAMAAVLLLLLKTVALSDLQHDRGLVLILVAAWGRWGQLVAIACYPYLKPTGKGAFHKTAIRSTWEVMPTLGLMLGFSAMYGAWHPELWQWVIVLSGGGCTIALGTGAWFNHKLGGHTGDTYGAVVEWSEALLLCLMTIV